MQTTASEVIGTYTSTIKLSILFVSSLSFKSLFVTGDRLAGSAVQEAETEAAGTPGGAPGGLQLQVGDSGSFSDPNYLGSGFALSKYVGLYGSREH